MTGTTCSKESHTWNSVCAIHKDHCATVGPVLVKCGSNAGAMLSQCLRSWLNVAPALAVSIALEEKTGFAMIVRHSTLQKASVPAASEPRESQIRGPSLRRFLYREWKPPGIAARTTNSPRAGPESDSCHLGGVRAGPAPIPISTNKLGLRGIINKRRDAGSSGARTAERGLLSLVVDRQAICGLLGLLPPLPIFPFAPRPPGPAVRAAKRGLRHRQISLMSSSQIQFVHSFDHSITKPDGLCRRYSAQFTGCSFYGHLFFWFPSGINVYVTHTLPSSQIHWPNIGPMLGQFHRWWTKIDQAFGWCIVFAGYLPMETPEIQQCCNNAGPVLQIVGQP